MKLSLFIAGRYLVSKKKQNIINIISAISMGGIIVGTLALVIVLSVFNGFSDLITSFFSRFDPDLKITPAEGKMFDPQQQEIQRIKNHPDVIHYAEIIEDVVLLKYGNQVYPAIMKGVPDNYRQYTSIDSLIVDGEFFLEKDGINYVAVGQGVAFYLGLSPRFPEPLQVYVPKKGNQVLINPARAVSQGLVYPSGVFAVLEEVDSKYIIVYQPFAARLFESGTQISSIELGIKPDANIKKIQKEIKKNLGNVFHVKTKYQQHDLVYKTMQSEKWAAYLILIFILIIASFNILGSLSMLIIDKKEDIMILQSMGATSKTIRMIFLFEGWLISLVGAVTGTLLGLLLCWVQITFGIISLPSNGSFLISAYPVRVVFSDILIILVVVLFIGFLASWYPVKYISKKSFSENNL
ncbi:MAG: FtsX-like permease family protein [Draconibacterium sp.]